MIFSFISINVSALVFNELNKKNNSEKCYISPTDPKIGIIHIILTRFMIKFASYKHFYKKLYEEDYILNGIRVMKTYLFPSLENQSCKEFKWVLMLGDEANITYIKSLLDIKNSFESVVIYKKDIKYFIRNITKGYDILITTRIDYDDRIYYDAVNDVRKAINIYKPMIVYGYDSGLNYYEKDNTYYEFNYSYYNQGVMSIFVSLIVVLKNVNDTYTIYDLGSHIQVRKRIIDSYKSFGIKELYYDPAVFDKGDKKFVWVRQKYAGTQFYSESIKNSLKLYNFNLTKFYGKQK